MGDVAVEDASEAPGGVTATVTARIEATNLDVTAHRPSSNVPAENASGAVSDAMLTPTARTGATRWTAPPAREVTSSVLPAGAASGPITDAMIVKIVKTAATSLDATKIIFAE